MITVNASAPVRVDLSGGVTDCQPFVDLEPAVHVNLAITSYCHVTITSSADSDNITLYRWQDQEGRLHLKRSEPSPASIIAAQFGLRGVRVELSSDVARGSGLGTSAATCVALVAAMAFATNRGRSRAEIAELAIRAERAAGNSCGKQDQYAAAFGGCNVWTFSGDSTHRLSVDSSVGRTILKNTLIVFSKQKRTTNSGALVDEISASACVGTEGVLRAYRRLNLLAAQYHPLLIDVAIGKVAELVSETRRCQSSLHPAVVDTRFMSTLAGDGVIGSKPCGGGGVGAAWLLVCASGSVESVRQRLESQGLLAITPMLDDSGVTVRRHSEVTGNCMK
jgi:D-glycero-alpha-D-manno-heptose-7-phosphate kinase